MSRLDRHRIALRSSGLVRGIVPDGTSVFGRERPGTAHGALPVGTDAARLLVRMAGGMRDPFSPGAPLVHRVQNSWSGPSAAGAAVWSLVDIEQQSRPVLGSDGTPLRFPVDGSIVGAMSGGMIRRWMNGELASACVREARERLNAAITGSDELALYNCLQWIIGSYNANNVPWQIHAPARHLWRRFISGGPENHITEWSGATNFNQNCTTQGNTVPRCYVGTSFGGLVPAAARAVFQRCAPSGSADAVSQFVPAYIIGQDAGAASTIVGGGLGPSRESDRAASGGSHLQNYADERGAGFGYVVDDACTRQPGGDPAWVMTGFDADFVGFAPPPLRLAGAHGLYVPWLSAWLDVLESLTPAQLVNDSLAFAMYLNAQTIQANGGSFDAALANEGRARLAEFTPDEAATADMNALRAGAPVLGTLATTLAAVAGAAGAASAGIGALVVGAVTAATLVTMAILNALPDESHVKLDDLLRARPWIEVNALDGSPGNLTASGAPSGIVVPAPPGYTPTADPDTSGPPPTIARPPQSAASKAGEVAIVSGAVVSMAWLANTLDWIDLSKLRAAFSRK